MSIDIDEALAIQARAAELGAPGLARPMFQEDGTTFEPSPPRRRPVRRAESKQQRRGPQALIRAILCK